MPFDYSDAPPPQFELIPHGTIATVVLHIRAGNAGEDGMLKRSKDGSCEMLDCEFAVTDGPFKGRKFWRARPPDMPNPSASIAARSRRSSTPRLGSSPMM